MESIGQLLEGLPALALDLFRLCLWLVLLMAVLIPLEKIWALRPQRIFRKNFATDLTYYFVNSLVPKLLLVVPLSGMAWAAHHLQSVGIYTWIAHIPLWTRLGAAILVEEAGSYWGHRWMHEVPVLWRFHRVHHSAEEMDWLVSTRAHPVDVVFTRLCGLIPMYLLGLAQPTGNAVDLVPVLVTLTGTIWGFFIHANVNWRLGLLERLVSTPAFHHWHHTNDGAEHVNKNYAALFPWMDGFFGTLYLPKKQWPAKYGIDAKVDARLAEQLLRPFEPHANEF